ncbi:cyclic nucleotide-binding domain-containing protein [Desulfonema magnum]|uniref:Cyclic nucleotide-binding domain-containing protein n=1 Tax=Desulfonema magnum TaxID=45655 RepID=A0A975BVA0_9BACT|nr:cyclic nucleotide-binding domain-containing protein [Desulfonema magnum]QTA92002.1 Cyclic nucleotide-binding domain-containing protein [Desulfonema magnum]
MLFKEDLKKIVMLSYLKDDMVEKLIPITDLLTFDEGETVFREKEDADRFYMLRRGKIVLEKRVSDKIAISVGSIKPGYAFGWSAVFADEPLYTSDAVCAEPCEIFSVRGKKIMKLLDEDPAMGYIFTQRLLRLVKSRLDHRTMQFLKAIKNHPDIQSLIKD